MEETAPAGFSVTDSGITVIGKTTARSDSDPRRRDRVRMPARDASCHPTDRIGCQLQPQHAEYAD